MKRDEFYRTPFDQLPEHLKFYATSEWHELKRQTLERDKGICQFCGGRATSADHTRPRRQGGKDTLDNLAATCKTCNEYFSGTVFYSLEEKQQYWNDRHDENGNVIRKKRMKNPLMEGVPF